MERHVLAIRADGGPFIEFYEALAQALAGRGTVFTPHPVIRPNERRASAPPGEVLVRLDDPTALEVVRETARTYLARHQDHALRLAGPAADVALRHGGVPDAAALRATLGMT